MFSARTTWDRTPNRLARALAARREAGASVLDLTESNPTRAGIEYPADLLAPLSGPAALHYDPDPRGSGAARAAVAADYARRGFEVTADEIVLTSSTSEAYSLLFKLLCDPGAEVLAPRPSYPLFEYLTRLDSVRLITYPWSYDGEWHIAGGALARALTARTRAVLVVNPGNPSGAYVKAGEAAELLELCAERGLAVVSDEVFADYAFEKDPHRITGLAAAGPALVFCLGGLSKSCGLPQLKLGWVAVSGPAGLRKEALARLEIVADTYLSVSTPVQQAAPALLARVAELQAPIKARLDANRQTLEQRLGGDAATTLLRLEGGWTAVLRIPATLAEEDRVVGLLERRGVLAHPGYFFDFDAETYLALSLITPPEVFSEGLERILEDLARE
jgi:alanine-synthesizing transaminase